MDIAKRLAAAVVAAAMIGGCASSGGGGGGGVTATYADGSTREITLVEALACLLTLGLACPPPTAETTATSTSTAAGAPTTTVRAAPSPAPFVKWPDHLGSATEIGSREITVRYEVAPDGSIRTQFPDPVPGGLSTVASTVTVASTSTGALSSWTNQIDTMGGDGRAWLPGQPGLVSTVGRSTGRPTPPFLDSTDPATPYAYRTGQNSTIGVIANPYVLGWDYQSFGVWASTEPEGGKLGASIFGATTPASAVPLSGAATFSGKLAGYYVSPSGQGSVAAADVRVAADFGTRTLTFASTGTTLTRNLSSVASAPGLNLGGALTYAPGSGAFSGMLTSASGTVSGATNGQFFGPAAQELGGLFALKSAAGAETFNGAYGARR